MKKNLIWFLSIILIFVMAFPTCEVYGKKSITTLTEDEAKELRTDNLFEVVISGFFLDVGDYAHDFLSKIFKEEITIDSLVYNRAKLTNANFFTKSVNPSYAIASDTIRSLINIWYDVFRRIAIIVCMVALVFAAVKIMLNTPNAKVKAMDLLKKIVLAVALLFLFPYVMLMAYNLNEAIITTAYNEFHVGNKNIKTAISEVSDIQPAELEFRSPDYVSKRILTVSAGSPEATQVYISRLEKFAESADVMRIMRAFAGITLNFLYVFIWYIMLAQLYMLAFVYIKRYITIAFLITIYPLTAIGYVAGTVTSGTGLSFNQWCKKFFSTLFLQSIHAITYATISSILIMQIKNEVISSGYAQINWLLMTVATSFLFTGEKILLKLWNAATGPEDKSGIKNVLGAPKKLWGKIKG